MESYFFIPGTKLHKIEDIKSLGVSSIIIDMEDAVKESDRKKIVSNLLEDDEFKKYYIRIPLYNLNGNLDETTLKELLGMGFTKFVFPKLNSLVDFEKLSNVFKNTPIEIILLVETPLFFLQVQEVLLKYKSFFAGIGIGSHDFMSVVGGVHTLDNIEYIRQQILYLARAIDIVAIDIASMELIDEKLLASEIIDGFKKGYDAKFYIHPWQLSVYKNINFYNEKEYLWAKSIEKELKRVGSFEEFNPVVINGQIIERPHLNKMKKILKYYKHESK